MTWSYFCFLFCRTLLRTNSHIHRDTWTQTHVRLVFVRSLLVPSNSLEFLTWASGYARKMVSESSLFICFKIAHATPFFSLNLNNLLLFFEKKKNKTQPQTQTQAQAKREHTHTFNWIEEEHRLERDGGM